VTISTLLFWSCTSLFVQILHPLLSL
jgi:hypothetical protein